MRLLQLDSEDGLEFSLVEFFGTPPPYAILSHTWGPNGTEVTHTDLVEGKGKDKAGYEKIRACGRQSAKAGYKYFWVDTCCIDKTSSAELSEAINSMYHWYEEADVCFAYLEDASPGLPVSEWSAERIKWFTRGWTLQELLAPQEVEFFASDWSTLGTRTAHAVRLSEITNIHSEALQRRIYGVENKLRNIEDLFSITQRMSWPAKSIQDFSVAQRMSWAAKRITTRSEDLAYCLLGIFNVNMPLLYGEGATNAFVRLQEEIMKNSNDQTLFAWRRTSSFSAFSRDPYSLLAESPSDFQYSGDFVPIRDSKLDQSYAMTNNGLRITLQMVHIVQTFHVALLSCGKSGIRVALVLKSLSNNQYGRVMIHTLELDKMISGLGFKRDAVPAELHCSSRTIYLSKVHSKATYDNANGEIDHYWVDFNREFYDSETNSSLLVFCNDPPPWQRGWFLRPFGIPVHFLLANLLLLSILATVFVPALGVYKYLPYSIGVGPVLALFLLRLRESLILRVVWILGISCTGIVLLFASISSSISVTQIRMIAIALTKGLTNSTNRINHERYIAPSLVYLHYHLFAWPNNWVTTASPVIHKIVVRSLCLILLIHMTEGVLLGRLPSGIAELGDTSVRILSNNTLCIFVATSYLYMYITGTLGVLKREAKVWVSHFAWMQAMTEAPPQQRPMRVFEIKSRREEQ